MPPLPSKTSFGKSDPGPKVSTCASAFTPSGGNPEISTTDSFVSCKSSQTSAAQAVHEATLDPSDWVLRNRRTGQEVEAAAFAEALLARRPAPQWSMTSPQFGTSGGRGWARGHRKKPLTIQRPTLLPQGGSDVFSASAAGGNQPLTPPPPTSSLKLSLPSVSSMTPMRARGRSFAGSTFSRARSDSCSLGRSNSGSTTSSAILSMSESSARAFKLSDMSTTQVIPRLHPGGIRDMSFSPSGEFLATCGMDQRCCIFRVIGRPQIAEEEGSGEGFAKQRNFLSMAGRLIEDQPMRVLTGHVGTVVALAWGGDDSVLLTASADGTVRSWHPLEGDECSEVYEHGGGVTSVAWDPAVGQVGEDADRGGRFLTGCMDAKIRLFSLGSSEVEQSVLAERPVTAVAFCLGGQSFAAGCVSGTVTFYRTAGMVPELTVECRRHGFRHTASQRARTSPVERLSVNSDSVNSSVKGGDRRRRRNTIGPKAGARVSGLEEERVTGLCFRPHATAVNDLGVSGNFSDFGGDGRASSSTPPSIMEKMGDSSLEIAPTSSVGGETMETAPTSCVGSETTMQQTDSTQETEGGKNAWVRSMADLLVSTNDNRSRVLVSDEGGGVGVGYKLKGHNTNGVLGRHISAQFSEDGNLIVSGSTDGHVHVFKTPTTLGSTTPRRAAAWSSGREGHERAQVCEKTVAVPVALFAPACVLRSLGGASSRIILTGDAEGNCKIFCERKVE